MSKTNKSHNDIRIFNSGKRTGEIDSKTIMNLKIENLSDDQSVSLDTNTVEI